MSEQVIDHEITEDDKLWALLAYVGIPPVLAPLFILVSNDKKGRPFLRYHAIQSLAGLFIAGVSCIPLIGCCLSPSICYRLCLLWLESIRGSMGGDSLLNRFFEGQRVVRITEF